MGSAGGASGIRAGGVMRFEAPAVALDAGDGDPVEPAPPVPPVASELGVGVGGATVTTRADATLRLAIGGALVAY